MTDNPVRKIPTDTDPDEFAREHWGERAFIPRGVDDRPDAKVLGYVEFESGFPRGVFAVCELEDGDDLEESREGVDRDDQTMALSDLGPRIRELRKAAGMTGTELGRAAGLAESSAKVTVHRWERGERVPSLDSLFRIADALDQPVQNLLQPPSR